MECPIKVSTIDLINVTHLFDLSGRFITLQVRKCHFLIYLLLFSHMQLGNSPLSFSASPGILGWSVMRYLFHSSPTLWMSKRVFLKSTFQAHTAMCLQCWPGTLVSWLPAQCFIYCAVSENLSLLDLKVPQKSSYIISYPRCLNWYTEDHTDFFSNNCFET